jgi:hypothetical protein
MEVAAAGVLVLGGFGWPLTVLGGTVEDHGCGNGRKGAEACSTVS